MELLLPVENERLIDKLNNNDRVNNSNKGISYHAYQVRRRSVVSSPEINELSKFTSPEIPRNSLISGNRLSDNLSQESLNEHNKFNKQKQSRNEAIYSKNPKYQSYSPIAPEVSLPGGIVYRVADDRDDISLACSSVKSLRNENNIHRSERNINNIHRSERSINNSNEGNEYNTSKNKSSPKHLSNEQRDSDKKYRRQRSTSSISDNDSVESNIYDEEDRDYYL